MDDTYRKRRTLIIAIFTICTSFVFAFSALKPAQNVANKPSEVMGSSSSSPALTALSTLLIKGRSPKNEYSRDKFGSGWSTKSGCDTRNIILNRDLTNAVVDDKCNVTSGVLDDPYSGKQIQFKRGSSTSGDVQIDHVVALSDAWQKGAQDLTTEKRTELANDPLELLAVGGSVNLQKSDGDAATWLPPNKPFRCQYIARQIAVKQKYSLWLTQAEYSTMSGILKKCPNQMLPTK